MEVFREFNFEAAHRLPNVPEGHKCSRLHGHSYKFVVQVAGPVDENLGWVMDFGEIKAVVQPVVRELDHYYLNEISGLENPTSEVLARWLWGKIFPGLRGLQSIEVRETCSSGCRYVGDTGP
ncbi:6-carboxytetrahydropterin synthase QueD [Williamsia herbipolensis]|uniref:6-carboxytetrahydropterin synthase QueD n=1 Tax=Williamsia herbipolensis TaxID=1603258 RepID=UPI0009E3108B|nr:6-carboxytetrahydropterin synthase QueD [Williamsia herbipolensis]